MSTPPRTPPRTPPARTRRPRVDRRQAIIDAAIELAGERAFDDVNVADIARRAGVSHGLLFYYFADKWAVATEALQQMIDALREAQAPLASEGTQRARLEGFTRRHIQFARERSTSYLALMQGIAMGRPEVRALLDEARRDGVAVLAAVLELPTPLDPMADLALWSWVATLDVCTEQVLTRTDLHLDAVVTWAVDRLVEAARPPGHD